MRLHAITCATAALFLAGSAAAQSNVAGPAAGSPDPAAVIDTPSPDLLFVPVAACRVFDTHATSPLSAARAFTISGTGNLTSQGGPKGGCGVPIWATAVAITLTTSSGDASGSIAAYPTGKPATASPAVSFNSTTSDSAGLSVAINSHQLTLKPSGGSAQVRGDVTGYYEPQIEAVIASDGTIYSQSGRIVSSTHTGTGAYTITVDRDLYGCSTAFNMQGGFFYGSAYSSNETIIVNTWTLNSTAAPVAADLYFSIGAHC